jgi:hypothetical protein
MHDFKGLPYALNYLRTKDGAEVDFCIVNDNKPELMIEVKRSDPVPGNALVNFNKRYNIPGIQLVLHLKREKRARNIDIRKGIDFLSSLII